MQPPEGSAGATGVGVCILVTVEPQCGVIVMFSMQMSLVHMT